MNTLRNKALLGLLGGLLAFYLAGCDFLGTSDASDETGLFPVQIDGRWGYINGEGRITIEPVFREAGLFVEGRARARLDGRRGFINAAGDFISEPHFESTLDFSNGLASVRVEGRWGFVDRSGNLTIAPRFRKACPFSEGRAFVLTEENGWEYINSEGQIIRSENTPEFRELEESAFSGGLALIKNHEGIFGFINRTGDPVITPQFSTAKPFSDGYAAVKISDRWGYIDKDKVFLINPRFIAAGDFHEGLAPVRENTNTWGYINQQGEMVIPPRFEEARSFSGDRAAVMLNGRWGYIDTEGAWIRDPEFAEATRFTQGLGRVRLDVGEARRYGYIDRAGRYVWYPSD